MVRKLTANDVTLTFQTDSNGWCRLELQLGEKTFPLGADMENIVLERLASGLDKELKKQPHRKIKEIDVVWILSLSEHHASLYAGNSGEHRVIFFQDSEADLIGSVRLDDKTRQQWFSELTAK